MNTANWVRVLAGAVIGIAGLLLLARLDIPHIEHGGIAGLLAGADLVFFSLLLAAALTVASMYGDQDR